MKPGRWGGDIQETWMRSKMGDRLPSGYVKIAIENGHL
jgi:hypothetical protein